MLAGVCGQLIPDSQLTFDAFHFSVAFLFLIFYFWFWFCPGLCHILLVLSLILYAIEVQPQSRIHGMPGIGALGSWQINLQCDELLYRDVCSVFFVRPSNKPGINVEIARFFAIYNEALQMVTQ
jgi:hypothetical protein